jgi:molecular chaperone HscA
VIPLSLGIETMGGLVEKIIPRNSTIPCARPGIHHLQGWPDRHGRPRAAGRARTGGDCRSLARFELRGIPPMVAGAARIRVTFQVDADGLLSVSARAALGRGSVDQRQAAYGLADDEIARMLQDSTSADTT